MRFQTLFVLGISHPYYVQNCQDFSYYLATDAVPILKGGRLTAKVRQGKLYVLFEAIAPNLALVSAAGKVLRIGLNLLNPFFSNFTKIDLNSNFPVYSNANHSNVLELVADTMLVGQIFHHSLTSTIRPVTVTLKNAEDQVVQSDVLTATSDRPTIAYNLAQQSVGVYRVEETDASTSTAYYVDAELQRQGAFGVVEVIIHPSFYNNPPEFQIPFIAKQETLKYYVVSHHYSDTEFAALSVVDAGEEGRSPISFTKVLPAAFTAEDLDPNLLASPNLLANHDAKIALFKSQTSVTRQEKARQKIQLCKNDEVLIPHLPQPGIQRVNADLIIPLAKP
jgi:hypothetical protein